MGPRSLVFTTADSKSQSPAKQNRYKHTFHAHMYTAVCLFTTADSKSQSPAK